MLSDGRMRAAMRYAQILVLSARCLKNLSSRASSFAD